MIILDVGEGAALTDWAYVWKLPGKIAEIADEVGFPKSEIVVKPQLFEYEPPNTPLSHEKFTNLYEDCEEQGLRCTASVFDKSSLEYLLTYQLRGLPFVKIANRPCLRKFIALVPRGVDVWYSYGPIPDSPRCYMDQAMCCVSDYPATLESYTTNFSRPTLTLGVSDHTEGLELYRRYRPRVYEKHFGLKGVSGPSLGAWSIDEDGLRELLTLAKERQ